ncbi:MAG: SRPBCC family protein [Acidobacteriaceae bacterium]
MNRWRSELTLAGLGAFAMYLLDPDRGKQRRARVKDAVVHTGYEAKTFSGRFQRDAANRVAGTIAGAEKMLQWETPEVSDEVLLQRVRSAVGRSVSHARALDVKCKDGAVELSGWVMMYEVDDLVRAVRRVPGVKSASAFLHVANRPGKISALQGGRRLRVAGLWRNRWSPTARVMAGSYGLSLLTYGLTKRGVMGRISAVAGALLTARAVWNRPMAEMAGVGDEAGIHIEKTMRILVSPEELYSFWADPENYPKVFTHLRSVKREGENRYRWEVAGPAGVPVSWAGTMTRKEPGKLVEWRSEAGAAVENLGVIHIEPEGNGYSRVHVQMRYTPPAGLVGHAVAVLLGLDPRSMREDEFVRLKSLFEEGKTHAHGREVAVSELKMEHPAAS